MDHHAFAAGRILQLVGAWEDSTNVSRKDRLAQEIEDILEGIASLPGCGIERSTSRYALSAASNVAQRKLRRSVSETKPMQTTATATVAPPKSTVENKQTPREVASDGRKAHEVELVAIREILGNIRSKATDLRSQVKHGDALVTNHFQKLAGVVQGVSDADRRLAAHERSSSSPAVRLVLSIPVVGPLLAPIAGILIQVMVMLFVVGTTLVTIAAMIFVRKPAYVG
jgi:hypothetical protein